MKEALLYLIPTTLGSTPVDRVLPAHNIRIVSGLRHFIVENIRTARRFLKQCDTKIDIDSLTFYELNEHTDRHHISAYLEPIRRGESVGIISEAGCPAIADPGADVVAIAQGEKIKVVPLVGPSSLLMAVMASGFNGQSFAFHGYLPIDGGERIKMLKRVENRAYSENQTQLFIETPYRNRKLAEEILQHCRAETLLCIAMNISCEDEYIVTKPVKAWRDNLPDMHKKPTVFLIYK